jgi:hypothetical protein
MMRALLAIALLCLSIPAYAAEPADPHRFGPGRHFLDSQGPQKAARASKGWAKHVRREKAKTHQRGSVSLAGVVAPLVAKAEEIKSSCGSVVVSAVSHRGNRSNHPIGRAVDMQGNPSCIYAHLKNWPGGVSTDYGSAPGGPHVHISYNPGGQEWGLRFAHRHARKRHRYAQR